MLRAYKYRLKPTEEQALLINKHIGSCRFVYNLALEVKKNAYATHRKNVSCYDLIGQLPELKKECNWLKEVDSQSLQQSIINLDRAFAKFFKGDCSFPKFKSKNKGSSFRNPHGNNVEITNGKLFQPKFKEGIKVIIDREFKGEIKNTTISRTPTGKYFVSILIETDEEIPVKKPIIEQTAVGIDMGIKSFIITSNGIKVDNPKHFKKQLSHLKYLQRQYFKKKKGSNNQKKYQFRVALCHEKINNQRKDFLQKLSTELIKSHDTLCFETLQIDNMLKNHKLAQAIQSASWGLFINMCKYKAEWKGNNILQIPTFQPSTKICSNCGAKNNALTLADREWYCVNCNILHDRDINAAANIKKYSIKNCGGVRRKKLVELPTLDGVLKQESVLF